MLHGLGNIGLLQANCPRLFAQFIEQFAEVLDGRRCYLLEHDRVLVGYNQKPGTRLQPQLFTDSFGNNDLPF